MSQEPRLASEADKRNRRVLNYCMRTIYIGMLREMPLGLVRKFWERHPIPGQSGRAEEIAAFEALWSGQGTAPIAYNEEVLNDIEPFLVEHGIEFPGYARRNFFPIWDSGIFGPEKFLEVVKVILPSLYKAPDPKQAVIQSIIESTFRAWENCWCGVVRHRESAPRVETVLAFSPERRFSYDLKHDWHSICRQFFIDSPTLFELPPNDSVTLLSESRDPVEIVTQAPVTETEDTLSIGGEPYGRKLSFRAWSESQGFSWDAVVPPDRVVVQMQRDYVCPWRKRPVLLAGCLYRAPVYIVNIEYARPADTRQGNPPETYLDRIFANLSTHTNEEYRVALEKHTALLKECAAPRIFSFSRKDRILALNGSRLCSGIQAAILAKILKSHSETGRQRFEFHEFKYDADLFHDPKRTSFETHLNRILDALRGEVRWLSIRKTGRGVLEFAVSGGFAYSESR